MNYKTLNDNELLYLLGQDDYVEKILYEKYRPIFDKYIHKYLVYANKLGLEYDDLLQTCYLSLYSALKKYHENEDIKFYTYLNCCIHNNLSSLIKREYNNKNHAILNNSLSYDIELPNSNSKYLDYIEDKSNILIIDNLCNIEEYLKFKNSMEYDMSCVFELYYNGYSKSEISKLLNLSIFIINKYLAIIKNKLLYIK